MNLGDDESLIIALRLAKAGYMGGDPTQVMRSPVDTVVAMLHYENFLGDYERTWVQMNRKET